MHIESMQATCAFLQGDDRVATGLAPVVHGWIATSPQGIVATRDFSIAVAFLHLTFLVAKATVTR